MCVCLSLSLCTYTHTYTPQDMTYFDQSRTGELVNRLSSDVAVVQKVPKPYLNPTPYTLT